MILYGDANVPGLIWIGTAMEGLLPLTQLQQPRQGANFDVVLYSC